MKEPKVTPIKELEFDPKSIVIAATTRYPNWHRGKSLDLSNTDKVRGDLAIQTIDEAIKHSYTVVINDGGSSKEFKGELAKRRIIVQARIGESRATARRQLIEYSSHVPQAKVILRMEPEKVSLVENCIPQLVEPILRDEADVVVPKRRQDLFSSSYPNYMYRSEMYANKKYNDILHEFKILPSEEEFDFFFGPVVFSNKPNILKFFLESFEVRLKKEPVIGVRRYLDPQDFSNPQILGVVKALYMGIKVKSIEVPFVYPVAQKENELINKVSFMQKRKRQKWENLDDLVEFIKYLNNPKEPHNVLVEK